MTFYDYRCKVIESNGVEVSEFVCRFTHPLKPGEPVQHNGAWYIVDYIVPAKVPAFTPVAYMRRA